MTDRANSKADEFQDPLENFEPPQYEDPLEQALIECPVADIEAQPCATIPSTATVGDALQKLGQIHHACLLVEEDGKLVGLLTDRDVLNNVALELPEIADQPVTTVMTADPVRVCDSDSAAATLCVMADSGYRHVPVVDLEGQIRGIVSPQRVTAFLLQHATEK